MGTSFILLWRHWRRQSMATAGPFRFHVLLAMSSIPVHLWSLDVVQRILGPY